MLRTIHDLYKTLTGARSAPTVPRGTWTTSIQEVDHPMKKLDLIAGALVIVGGLNWGLVALAEFDLVAWICGEEFGTTNAASRIVYGLVGLSAAYGIGAALTRRSSGARHPATSY